MVNFLRISGILRISAKLRDFYAKHIFAKKRVGTNKGQWALIRDNWYFFEEN